MMPQIFNSFLKSKLAIPLAVVAVTSVTFLTVSHYKIGQTASVISASCYSQSEIDQMKLDKATLENEVTNLNNELTYINTELVANSESITTAQSKIDALGREMVSDYTIEQKKAEVDAVYRELNDRKTIESILSQYKDKNAEITSQTATLSLLLETISTSNVNLTNLSTQVTAKKNIDYTNTFMLTVKDASDKLLMQAKDKKILDDKFAEVSKANTIANTAKSDTTTTGIQNYKTLLAKYNTLLAEYNKMLANYKAKYTSYLTSTYANLVILYNAEVKKYNDYASKSKSLATQYAIKYKGDTKTLTELNTLYNTDFNKYKQLLNDQRSLNTVLTKNKAEALELKASYDTSSKSYNNKYGYTSATPTLADVQTKYDSVSSTYNKLVQKNNEIKEKISKLNTEKTGYENTITELNNRFTTVQNTINEKTQSIAEHANAIANATVCPTTETSCSNGVDDDNDKTQDCDDRDCAYASECQIGPLDAGTTGVNITDIDTTANIDIGSNTNANIDTITDITNNSSSEVCDNGTDDDADGLIDCGDNDCANDSACVIVGGESESSCDDGVDNDGNGAADCEDSACVSVESCQCNVTDDLGNTIGTCAEFDSSIGDASGGLDGGKNNGNETIVVKNPSDCPKGTTAEKIGVSTIKGKTTVYYRCVDNGGDYQEDKCGNGEIDSGEECEVGDQIENGKCVYCGVQCNDGWTKQKKEDWVPQIPLLGGLIRKMIKDEWYCSQLGGLNDKGLSELDAEENKD